MDFGGLCQHKIHVLVESLLILGTLNMKAKADREDTLNFCFRVGVQPDFNP